MDSLEKKINKLDLDIEALRRAKNYLSNKEEINEIMDYLNRERQVYADEIYIGDGRAYDETIEEIKLIMNKELDRNEQSDLLELIKKNYGRKTPNISKKAYGLNAWLKFLDVKCEWKDNENGDWGKVIITDILPRK